MFAVIDLVCERKRDIVAGRNSVTTEENPAIMKRQIRAGASLMNLTSISCSLASFINFVLEFFRVNQALQFDGVDDHVLLPSIHSLGLTDRYFLKVMLLCCVLTGLCSCATFYF